MGSVEPLIVNDSAAPEYAEYEDIPAVSVFGMRSYIGVPIVLSSGQVFGTLCALDRAPQQKTQRDLDTLLILARLLASQIDRREIAIIEERQRIAREIHDTIAQSLSGLVLDLALLASNLRFRAPELTSEVLGLQDIARQSLREVRRSIWNLQPGALAGRTLPEALNRELKELERVGIETALELRGRATELPAPVETAVLRICQESLANVRKHAQASHVIVTLEYQPDDILLHVDDDGIGIDLSRIGPARPESGAGLNSMRERARLAGGELTIEVRPGGGTSVTCILPRSGPEHAPPQPIPSSRRAAGKVRITVGVIDDHAIVRQGLRRLIEESGDIGVLCEAADGEEALRLVRQTTPDIVLLDMQLPKLSGIHVLEQLPSVAPKTRVIVLTTWAQDEMVFQAIRHGAKGYLLKEATGDELIQAIRTVAAGGTLLTAVAAERLAKRVHRRDMLTAREREVLELLAEGLRNKEIAVRLGTSEKTVQFHIANIFAKFGVQSRTEAVRAALDRGLLLAGAR
jgi:DNA-binding NarL/FixJ family response regulator/signal transduction histidine kinase